MSAVLSVIGAPSSAGAYAPGQERAPAAFRRYGLLPALAGRGYEVIDRGDVPGFRWQPDAGRPKAMNLDAVAQVAAAVRDQVASAMAEEQVAIVLGGDCTVELGSVAGASQDGSRVGLLYIDLDTDLNTPAESDGALDWTGVAHLLDLPGVAPELASLGSVRPLLGPQDLFFLAVNNITEPEAATIARLNIATIRLAEARGSPERTAELVRGWAEGFERVLVHVDVDVLDFTHFPIAENTRRCAGLTLDELRNLLGLALGLPNWRVLTVTEVNPDHAPDEKNAFEVLSAILANSLARGATARTDN